MKWLSTILKWSVLLPLWERVILERRWQLAAALGTGLAWLVVIIIIAAAGGGDDEGTGTTDGTPTETPSSTVSSTDEPTPDGADTPTPTTQITSSPSPAPTEPSTPKPTVTSPPVTDVPTEQPTPAATCEAVASVDVPNPVKNSTVVVTGVLTCTGISPEGASMDTAWNYKSTTSACAGSADGNGVATCSREIGGASSGFEVRIDVTFTLAGEVYNAITGFTPQ